MLTAFILIFCAVLGPTLLPAPHEVDRIQVDVANLNTLAQVTGAIYGALLAVVTFSVGLRSQREDDALLPFVARRYHMFFVGAIGAAVTMVDGIMPILQPLVPHGAVQLLLLLNILLIPGALALSLWLACKVIQDAAVSNFENTLPVFKATMRATAAQEAREDALFAEYTAALGRTKIDYNFIAWYGSPWAKGVRETFSIAGGGHVRDVDLHALRRLGNVISTLGSKTTAEITARPGEQLTERALLVLGGPVEAATARDDDCTQIAQTPVDGSPVRRELQLRVRHQIDEALRSLFITGEIETQSPRDVRNFFDRIKRSLITLAREGRAIQFRAKLAEYQELFDAWLEIAPPGAETPVPFSLAWTEPGFAGPLQIDLYDVIRAAEISGDAEVYVTAIDAVANLLIRARDVEQPRLYGDLCAVFRFAYSRGAQQTSLQAAAGAAIDRDLHSLLLGFKTRDGLARDADDESRATAFSIERPYLDRVLGLCLWLIRIAMERGDAKHAGQFFERLVQHRSFQSGQLRIDNRTPSTEDADTLHDFAILAIGAWAFHLLEQDHAGSAEAAQRVFSRALGSLPRRLELAGLWELYNTRDAARSSITQRLGVERWDLRDRAETRVGVPETYIYRDDWLIRGLYAGLLRAAPDGSWDIDHFFQTAPPRFLWKTEKLEDELRQIAAEPHVGVPEPDRDEAVASVKSLILMRQQVADSAYEEHAATAPLDPESCEMLRREVTDSVRKAQRLIHAVQSLGVSNHPATLAPKPLRWNAYVPRDALILGESRPTGFGAWVANLGAHREEVQLVGSVESSVELHRSVGTLSELAEAVREARRELVNRGYEPNCLIIPGLDRFASALFRKPLWRVEQADEFGGIGYGIWEALHVLRFPYTDPQSAIVADTRALFGTTGDSAGKVEVTIRELSPDDRAKLAAQDRREDGADTTRRARSFVSVTVDASPVLGIAAKSGASSPDAALRLDISECDGCFALLLGDSLYHRPSCPNFISKEQVHRSLMRRMPGESKDREPCTVCRPELWDGEGRVGQSLV